MIDRYTPLHIYVAHKEKTKEYFYNFEKHHDLVTVVDMGVDHVIMDLAVDQENDQDQGRDLFHQFNECINLDLGKKKQFLIFRSPPKRARSPPRYDAYSSRY